MQYAPKTPAWKLQDAKAHFSAMVREAQHSGPQRVTVHGKDAVVVVAAAEFDRLTATANQPSLYTLLSTSPLTDLELETGSVRSPVRDVEL